MSGVFSVPLLLLALAITAESSPRTLSPKSSCPFPNGTENALNWWQCGGSPTVVFQKAEVVDSNGIEVYPIRLTEPVFVNTQLINNGPALTSPSLIENIRIYEYSSSFSSDCYWSEIPTFGLLKNLDACAVGISCPVMHGSQFVIVTIDFTKFNTIIRLLTNDVPYMLMFELFDKSSGNTACISAQARGLTE